MIYHKGSIVPRWLVKVSDRKAQHFIKFGCDVIICGKEIRPLQPGAAIEVRSPISRRMNNGTRKKDISVYIAGVSIIGLKETVWN